MIFRARPNLDIRYAFRLLIVRIPGLANSFKYGQSADMEKVINSSSASNFSYSFIVKRFTLSTALAENIKFANKMSLGFKFKSKHIDEMAVLL